ncbi:MAG: LytTR family transcriptional regulator [Roseibium sp.]|uniref:LytTR family DNA-binding domain-containing protein n=1 Tax=Roseibium sp. TaxID=1936156 RepID=UPI0026201D56|nr:LytTR family DNA-binding domain-containing protein [Roseibium sp.]MCV0429377.1 LytTR family transcriptional regulator [Roseibium sp.]
MLKSFAKNTVTHRLLREFAAPFATRHSVLLLIALSLFAGLIGPFGTYGDFPIVSRLFYWTVMVLGTASVGHVTATSLERLLGKTCWPGFVQQTVLSVLVAIPVCLVVATISAAFGFSNFTGSLLSLYAQCALVTGFVVILFNLLPIASSLETEALNAETLALLARLPMAKRGRILRLMAQDHYVEIVTDRGSTLVSMRFRDAMMEVGTEQGLQIHRSHWVALHAVAGRYKSGKHSCLRLSDGSFVPVGRTFSAKVKKKITW